MTGWIVLAVTWTGVFAMWAGTAVIDRRMRRTNAVLIEAAVQRAKAEIRAMRCDDTLVTQDEVDGHGVTRCHRCLRWCETQPWAGPWLRVPAHQPLKTMHRQERAT